MKIEVKKIGVIGLGYVGLPLAIEFAKKYAVIGFDINSIRISELLNGIDLTKECSIEQLAQADSIHFTHDVEELFSCNFFIITVPTPINNFKTPDLSPLLSATRMIARILKKNDIVIYESTVYPGCTEEDCVPILEEESGLIFNKDFFCGYSPERINPGDRINTLTNIKKVTSGSNPEIADIVDNLYSSIISAGTFKAASIKVAEASKAIENAQRDINISFVNEIALIFDKMNIDTTDVLEAASTKWNFLKFKPGLVGGHCIGVDPYYLAHKAESYGYYPQVILSGRRVNDQMGMFVANKSIKLMVQKGIVVKDSHALILGASFKENCPDFRNSKVLDIYKELNEFGVLVDIYDPHVIKDDFCKEFKIVLVSKFRKYDLIILAVSHNEFTKFDINSLKKTNASVVFDTKSFLDRSLVDSRL